MTIEPPLGEATIRGRNWSLRAAGSQAKPAPCHMGAGVVVSGRDGQRGFVDGSDVGVQSARAGTRPRRRDPEHRSARVRRGHCPSSGSPARWAQRRRVGTRSADRVLVCESGTSSSGGVAYVVGGGGPGAGRDTAYRRLSGWADRPGDDVGLRPSWGGPEPPTAAAASQRVSGRRAPSRRITRSGVARRRRRHRRGSPPARSPPRWPTARCSPASPVLDRRVPVRRRVQPHPVEMHLARRRRRVNGCSARAGTSGRNRSGWPMR